ncbi:putative RAP protein [Plasmodium gaboni]|uniref:Putative RAP protein n=1 Tax=Plasmodium gaboni TaxID=647221 RepID=A0A151LGN5_9APIC|nr:putative RAP protein [Plasmodium gaboni]KYN98066.1 putative RAP protein [Plasmodium gaboni]
MFQRKASSVCFFNKYHKTKHGYDILFSSNVSIYKKALIGYSSINNPHHNNNNHHNNNSRYRKIIVIPFNDKDMKLEYKKIPFDKNDLDKKSKKELLNIYKHIRIKDELNKLPHDFLDNLFECTKKYVGCLLPYEFVSIYKTLKIIKKNNKDLNLLLHQQMKRIYENFDITSISKLFQLYNFSRSKPTFLIKILSRTFLKNMNNENIKPWNIRELISIYCYLKIYDEELIDSIYKKCIPIFSKYILNYEPKDVTIIFYCLIKMNKHNTILSNVVTKHVILNIDSYEFHQVAIVLNTFAKVGVKNNKLCKVISDKIKRKLQPDKYTHLENNIMTRREGNNKYLYNSEEKKKKKSLNPYNVENLNGATNNDYSGNENDKKGEVNRFEELDRGNKETNEIISIDKIDSTDKNVSVDKIISIDNSENKKSILTKQILEPKDVSIILNSLIRLEYYDNQLFHCLIPYIINNVSKFSVQSLSNIVHSFSQIQIYHEILFDNIIKECIKKIHKFKNIEMSNLANSLVRLNRKDKILFTYIIDEFLYRATIGSKFLNYHFDIISLQQLAYSFSKVGLKDDKIYTVLYRMLIKKINEKNKILRRTNKISNNNKLIQVECNKNGDANKINMNKKKKKKKNEKENKINEKGNKINEKDIIERKEISIYNNNSNNNNSSSSNNNVSIIKNSYDNFDFFSLCTFINSYGQVNIKNKHFCHFISYIIRKKKKNNEILTNESLSFMLYGLLKLNLKDKKIYQILLKECIEKVDTLKPFQMVLLLYSLSKLKIYSYKFVKKCLQILSININNLNLSDLSLVCYSLSNFLYRDVIFLYKVNKIILLNNYEFNPKIISQLFNSYTKLCYYHEPFYDFIFKKIIIYIHHFDEKELSNLVYSFMYYFHMKKLHYDHIKNDDKDKKNDQPIGYVQMERGENKIGTNINNGDSKDIKYVINVQNNNKKQNNDNKRHDKYYNNNNNNNNNCYINQDAYCRYDQSYDTCKNINHSTNTQNNNSNDNSSCNNKDDIILYREEFYKNELNIFFNLIYILNEKYRTKISLISIYQLQIVDLYLRSFFKNYFYFPIYLKTFFFKCRNIKLNVDDYIILSSKTHRNISRFLNIVGIRHRSEVLFGPYQLDIVIDFLEKKNPDNYLHFLKYQNCNKDDKSIICDNISNDNSNDCNIIYKAKRLEKENIINNQDGKYKVIEKVLNKNIVIEVDGISHFYKESFSRTINSVIKDYILKKLGWNIIHIPYQEWNQCFTFKKKVLYAIEILKNILQISNQDISVENFIHMLNEKNIYNEKKIHHHTFLKSNMTYMNVSYNNNMGGIENEIQMHSKGRIEDISNEQITNNMNNNNNNNNYIPKFYTVSEENIFLNQIKNKNTRQQNIMKKMREDSKLKYDYNISCKKINEGVKMNLMYDDNEQD